MTELEAGLQGVPSADEEFDEIMPDYQRQTEIAARLLAAEREAHQAKNRRLGRKLANAMNQVEIAKVALGNLERGAACRPRAYAREALEQIRALDEEAKR